MQHFTFRLAQNDDLSAIVDIWRENIINEYSISPQVLQRCTATLIDLFLARNGYCNFWVVVSEESEQVIGWNSFVAILPTILKKDTTVESSTYIHCDYQRHGIAFKLMTHCLTQLKTSTIDFVFGFANESKIKMHKLLTKLGFEQCGKLPKTGVFPYNESKLLFIYVVHQ